MGMFSEISAGSNADRIANHILKMIEQYSENRDLEIIKKCLLPLYESELSDAWGCQNKDLEKQINELFK